MEWILSQETGLGIRPRYPPLHFRCCSGGNGAGASTASPALRTPGNQRTATVFPEAAELELEGADRLSCLHPYRQSLSKLIFASGSATSGRSWAPCPLRQTPPSTGSVRLRHLGIRQERLGSVSTGCTVHPRPPGNSPPPTLPKTGVAIQAVRFAAAGSPSESLRKCPAVSGDCSQPHCPNNPAGSPHPSRMLCRGRDARAHLEVSAASLGEKAPTPLPQ